MSLLLPPLRPTFEAALRDVGARGPGSGIGKADMLATAEKGSKREA